MAAPGRAGRFQAWVGERLLCTARTPLLSGARVLQGEGVPGCTVLQLRHAGSEVVAMHTTVDVAAGLTVEESDKGIPRFEPWTPFGLERPASPRRVAQEAGAEAG